MHRIATFVIFVAACGGQGPASSPPTTAASTAPAADAGRPSVAYGIEGTPEGVPLVVMNAAGVTVDGANLDEADVASIKKGKRSDGLFRALQERKKAHATDSAAGRAAFDFDRETPWAAVESAVGAAARAGYPRAALLTRLPKDGAVFPSHLELEVRLDKKKTSERELHVSLSSHGSVMLRWMEGSKQIGDVVSSEAVVTRLEPFITRGWNERGLHREPNDRQFDQAVLHIERDTPYAVVVVALDALHSAKRKLGGTDVPALTVNVAVE
ncbi:MAG TPA: hypothetical protein VM925_34755 [Labilithrix sp.]|nr:hypothetical protein [Labilithrix sp.]